MRSMRRGSGVRHTLPFFGRFAGLWLVVTLAAVLVAALTTYLLFLERGDAGIHTGFVLNTVLIMLAVTGLGIFTTHRLAGPWIAVLRALQAVRDGDLNYRLRIRTQDSQIHNVEVAFEEMLASLRRRCGEPEVSATGATAEQRPPTTA